MNMKNRLRQNLHTDTTDIFITRFLPLLSSILVSKGFLFKTTSDFRLDIDTNISVCNTDATKGSAAAFCESVLA